MNRQNRFTLRNTQDLQNEGPVNSELTFNVLSATGSGVQGPTGPCCGTTGSTGPQGRQGITGPQGRQGFIGVGLQGVQGRQGSNGPTGGQGFQGPPGGGTGSGSQGPQGRQGSNGPTGGQGFQGPPGGGTGAGSQGTQGSTGSQGRQGVTGPQGRQGFQGPPGGGTGSGSQGTQGSTGSQGRQGVTGPQGRQGVTGSIGPEGRQGFTGPQGRQGLIGPTGSGNQGTQGNTGIAGIQGLTGPQGSVGNTGAAGPAGPTGPANGPQGLQGIRGNTGGTGPGLVFSSLPTNTPQVLNNTLFETSGATLSKTTFKEVFKTIMGLTTSALNSDSSILVIGKKFENGVFVDEAYRVTGESIYNGAFQRNGFLRVHLNHSYSNLFWESETTFNNFTGTGSFYDSLMEVNDPRYNIGRYLTHGFSQYTGVKLEVTLKFQNGGSVSVNQRDEFKLLIQKDGMTDEKTIIGTSSLYNTASSIHKLQIYINQQTDFDCVASVDRTVYVGGQTHILDTQYFTYFLGDFQYELGGRIKFYIPNGQSNGSRVLNFTLDGDAWVAQNNIY